MIVTARVSRFSAFSALLFTVLFVMAAWGAGCGSNNNGDGGFSSGGADGGDSGSGFGNGSEAGSTLIITPPNPTVAVTILNGAVTAPPVSFTATADGKAVTATWSLDRGELGTFSAAGVFTASGTAGGIGVVTASANGLTGSTKVTVTIKSVQVGNPYGAGGPPPAGPGGVGGEGLGGPVDTATQTALTSTSNPPATPSALGFLYPYDKTVFPRGMLAPLLQWQSNAAGIDAVSIHLSEANYDFQGFYAVTGASQFHQPIDASAWTAAANTNGGDPLHVEVKLHAGTTVVGPISEDWTMAPGILSGTIYYQSYTSQVAGSAGTLQIRPGKTDPELAIPGSKDKCIVCHEVSEDGSTLFAQDQTYQNGASYDLRDGGAVIQSYVGLSGGTSSDGTANGEKFVWSALSKDGTFALENQDDGNAHTEQAAGTMAPQGVYRRDNGNAATTTGFDVVTQAVTPAFSHDGTKVAFNGWTLAASAAPLTSGNGHTLDIMDFACGAGGTAPGPSCSSMAFSNLRRLYTNADATNGFVGWPAWTPDNKGIAFQNGVRVPSGAPLQTRFGSEAQLWYTDVPATGVGTPLLMNAANGLNSAGSPYLPATTDVAGSDPAHSDDVKYNYEPTINPVPSAGYFWVVFTSRRMYGNVATTDPYSNDSSQPIPKKLWVAAIDINPAPGVDPSHPAFYLPGQELDAPNMRGFWVVDPCRADGTTCDTGAECCGGYCRAGTDGGLVCGANSSGCSNENEKCTTSSDCCGGGSLTCINGFCEKPGPR